MSKDNEMILVTPTENVGTFFKDFKDNTGIILNKEIVNKFVDTVNDLPYENVLVKRRGDMEVNEDFKQFIAYTLISERDTGKYLVYRRLSQSGETRLQGNLSLGIGGHSNLLLDEVVLEKVSELNHVYLIENHLDTIYDQIKHNGAYAYNINQINTYIEDKESVVSLFIIDLKRLSLDSSNMETVNTYLSVVPFLIEHLNIKLDVKELLAENSTKELNEELEFNTDIDIEVIGLLNNDTDDVGKVHVCYLQTGIVDSQENVKVNPLEADILEIVGWYTKEELLEMSESHTFEAWSKIIIDELNS